MLRGMPGGVSGTEDMVASSAPTWQGMEAAAFLYPRRRAEGHKSGLRRRDNWIGFLPLPQPATGPVAATTRPAASPPVAIAAPPHRSAGDWLLVAGSVRPGRRRRGRLPRPHAPLRRLRVAANAIVPFIAASRIPSLEPCRSHWPLPGRNSKVFCLGSTWKDWGKVSTGGAACCPLGIPGTTVT